jgi:hypothetical protein
MTVARVYADNIGALSIDFSLTPFTFSSNGRDMYTSGWEIGIGAVLMAHLSLDAQSGALAYVDAVRDEVPVSTFGGF